MITYINNRNLEPHPDNPRRELGDLSELVASIRKQGILQNLTVVTSPDKPGKYRIVIGHRRFAAAKIAGVDDLPCAINAEMKYPEQLAVMMSENIQRSDLTITEKVGGVQMLMDFGMDAGAIASNTGISETSVRRYAKLAALNKKAMKQAEQRGATLMQFQEISDIEDDDLRSEALDKAGTAEYGIVMNRVNYKRTVSRVRPLIVAKLKEFAEQIDGEDYNRYQWQTDFWYNDVRVLERIGERKPQKGRRYVFIVKTASVSLYMERADCGAGETQAQIAAAERLKARRMHEREIAKQFRDRRDAYMTGLKLRGREEAAKRFVLWVLTRSEYMPAALNSGRFADGFELDGRGDSASTGSIRIGRDEIDEIEEKQLLTGLVLVAYDRISDMQNSLMNSIGKMEERTAIIRGLYHYMAALGYPISAEERAWMNGTHECWTYPHGEAQ